MEAALQKRPEGISLADLHAQLGIQESQRTLARRISALLKDGRAHKIGKGPGTRYFAGAPMNRPVVITPATGQLALAAASPELISSDELTALNLSTVARDLLDYVSRPMSRRPPVGYERALLDDYIPNETSYLPDRLKAHLYRIGQPIAAIRPAGTFARDILGRLLIDLSWASSRLEGNTYSRLDTERLIQFGEAAPGKDAKETQMILNHKQAIELLVEDEDRTVSINEHTLLNLHAILSDGLMADPEASGRLRRRPVDIGGSAYTPTGVPQLIQESFATLIAKAGAIVDPFERAFFVMVQLPYLQPFEDVNKRVSRLAANIPLIQSNLCPLSFVDVPERAYVSAISSIYETTRVDLLREVFAWAYERSCQKYVVVRDSLIEPDLFRLRYRNALSEVVRTIVHERRKTEEAEILALASPSVAEADLPIFVALVTTELRRLHEGNIARHRIRLAEFRSWLREQPPGG